VRLDVDATMSEHLQLSFLSCRDGDRLAVLLQLLRQQESQSQHSRTIVFCATMKHVELIAAVLRHANVQCSFLYSQLDAVARNMQINRFLPFSNH
jgi:superfamily II DNA/RNA helicase